MVTLVNLFIDVIFNTRKLHSLMERCVSFNLLIGFLILRIILIIMRFVMKKKSYLCIIKWMMMWSNGRMT